MIPCNSVAEEYRYVLGTRCKCGSTLDLLDLVSQNLISSNEDTLDCHDVISCHCLKCGQDTEFAFDISSFFGKEFSYLLRRKCG